MSSFYKILNLRNKNDRNLEEAVSTNRFENLFYKLNK